MGADKETPGKKMCGSGKEFRSYDWATKNSPDATHGNCIELILEVVVAKPNASAKGEKKQEEMENEGKKRKKWHHKLLGSYLPLQQIGSK